MAVFGETLKTKWKSIRDNFQKYLRANKTTTGHATGATKGKYLDTYKYWSWAKHLEFLKPHLSFATYVYLYCKNLTIILTIQIPILYKSIFL